MLARITAGSSPELLTHQCVHGCARLHLKPRRRISPAARHGRRLPVLEARAPRLKREGSRSRVRCPDRHLQSGKAGPGILPGRLDGFIHYGGNHMRSDKLFGRRIPDTRCRDG